jgi:hypothetical protein
VAVSVRWSATLEFGREFLAGLKGVGIMCMDGLRKMRMEQKAGDRTQTEQ